MDGDESLAENGQRGPLSERTDEEVTYDITAGLQLIAPIWVRAMDPITLPLMVRD